MTRPATGGVIARDREAEAVHKKYWDNEVVSAGTKSVLLVEGDDDLQVLEAFLRRRSKKFSTRVRVIAAGGRARVLERLASTFGDCPTAYGLVDRDTWNDSEVAAQRGIEPRLYVTEGWCIENAFLSREATRHCENLGVDAALEASRETWVRAGALWWTLQRGRQAQQRWQENLGWSYGNLRPDLDLTSATALAASLNSRIPAALRNEVSLDADAVAAEFSRRCGEVLALEREKQWQVGVHGKCAFVGLLAASERRSASDLRIALSKVMRPPPPIDDLLALLLG